MATTRTLLDDRGKSILELFVDNMATLGNINMSAAASNQIGSYDGSWGEVNINNPRIEQATRFGENVEPGHEYFVREIEFPAKVGDAFGKNDFLPERDHDTIGSDKPVGVALGLGEKNNAVLGETRVDKYTGKSTSITTVLNTVNDYSGEYKDNPQNFMRLKGRKSLFTLLQETWSVFFSDDDGGPVYRNTHPVEGEVASRDGAVSAGIAGQSTVNNRYKSSRAYDFNFYAEQGQSFVDEPSTMDFHNSAMQGFVLGQVMGGNITLADNVRTEAQDVSREFFEGLGAATDDFGLSTFYDMLSGIVGVDRISQLYVAGWGRPAENYLTKKPLIENLQQNLLLPPSVGNSFLGLTSPLNIPGNTTGNGVGTPGYGDTNATFQSLYTRNRGGAAGGINASNPIFNNGVVAGTAINLLQEPAANRSLGLISGAEAVTKPDTVPFSFEKDDAQYLTYDKRASGFTNNGPVTNTDASKIEPMVKDFSSTLEGTEVAKQVVAMGQGQYFPFTFSTVNKKTNGAGRFQVCFLQANLNSLSESYTPTWASKHFFGRSEQAHTYTFTDRTMDLSFTIFANEMRQLQNVYERVLWLAQQCYPDYDTTGRMSEGPIVALRIGDVFQYKTGIIRSLSYDWLGFGGGKWEMTAAARMPQGCTVTMSYQIIHDNVPTRDTDFYNGPGGGLNTATQRYRTLGSETTGIAGQSPFDSFEQLDELGLISEVGYGERFLDAGVMDSNQGENLPYLSKVEALNEELNVEGNGGVRQTLQVPVLDDNDKLIYV